MQIFLKIDPRVSELADPEIWHSPLTLLVVLTTLSHYRVRCDTHKDETLTGSGDPQVQQATCQYTNLAHESLSDFRADSTQFIVWCGFLLAAPSIKKLFHLGTHDSNYSTFTTFKKQTTTRYTAFCQTVRLSNAIFD